MEGDNFKVASILVAGGLVITWWIHSGASMVSGKVFHWMQFQVGW